MLGTMPTAPAPSALLLRRLAALFYDFWVCVALWLLLSLLFTLAFNLSGHGVRENIAPFSAWQWGLWACCWLTTGAYAVLSWRRGGQTLGMRAWKIAVVDPAGRPAATKALWRRFAWGGLSLLAFGAGFWWALLDRQRLGWHDRASATRLVRLPPR